MLAGKIIQWMAGNLVAILLYCGVAGAAPINALITVDGDHKETSLFIRDHEQTVKVLTSAVSLPGNNVAIEYKSEQNKPYLALSFKNSWSSGLFFTGNGLDLRPYLAKGTVDVQLRVNEIEQGSLDVSLACKPQCHPRLRLREWAQSVSGKGWQHLSIPLKCVIKKGADISRVFRLFNLETGGAGRIDVGSVAFHQRGDSNIDCLDDQHIATTPNVLNEYWSVNWWMPRHQKRVESAKSEAFDVVLLGDSITEGWGKSGEVVWQKYFPDVNMLNLGFGGDRTENVLWRLQHNEMTDVNPDLAVIMVGTNNTGHRMDSPEAIRDGIEKIIHQVKKTAPDTAILLYAIFPRGATLADPMRINNTKTNSLLATLAARENILFENINKHFLTPDGQLSHDIMPDLLHPQQEGYEIWANQLAPFIKHFVRGN